MNCLDNYYNAIKACREAYDIAVNNNININIIDIGGGFPGIYSDNNINIEQIAETINKAQRDFFSKEIDEDVIKFIAEPGRYFVEKSHILVLNVIGKKREQYINKDTGKLEEIIIYYLNDGVYGSFNCIYFDHNNPVVLPFNERNNELHKSRLFGPTCDSIDLISNDIMLPELAVGEWVYVENFGAYTVASSSNFNGFKTNVFKYIFRS
mgnify:CR=1 FL=1